VRGGTDITRFIWQWNQKIELSAGKTLRLLLDRLLSASGRSPDLIYHHRRQLIRIKSMPSWIEMAIPLKKNGAPTFARTLLLL
jgi:hypothetical protein